MFPPIKLTDAGRALIVKSLHGDCSITFTHIGIGKGNKPDDISSLTKLTSPVKEVGIGSITTGEGGANITAIFDNSSFEDGFWWSEIGIFAEDPQDGKILYGYANSGDKADYIPSYSNTTVLRTTINITVAVGDTENFNAVISEFIGYVSTEVFENHVNNTNNPHNVTADDVGLGEVPNVSTNDQTPTFEDTKKFENILSGEKLSIIMSKIKLAINKLISHLNGKNPHAITCDTIDAAKASHLHSTNDINEGKLPLSHGGTGVDSIESFIDEYTDLHIPKMGSYVGNGKSSKTITMGFTPSAVFIITKDGTMSTVDDLFDGYTHGGLALKNSPATSGNGNNAIVISEGGFTVYYSSGCRTNKNGTTYHYIAWR